MTTITAEDFRDFRLRYGSTRTVADACDVTERQVRRWEAGVSRVPRWSIPYLRMLAGELGAIDPQWEGWRLQKHCLHTPGVRGPSWDIYTLCATAMKLTDTERRERELMRRIDELEREILVMQRQLREATDQVEQLSLFTPPTRCDPHQPGAPAFNPRRSRSPA
jgi:DNA-binding transcriptional MerR regulator